MKIRELMTDQVVTVSQNEAVTTAARLLKRHNVGALPVCDDNGRLRGIVTDRDIVLRCIGKYFGARWSAKASGCDENIVKYLGITLFPQAGVALGMAAQALTFGGDIGVLAQSITLFAVLIYELVGPALTKIALTNAGDIKAEGKTNAREEAKKAMAQK